MQSLYASWDVEEIFLRLHRGLFGPDAEATARRVLAERGFDHAATQHVLAKLNGMPAEAAERRIEGIVSAVAPASAASATEPVDAHGSEVIEEERERQTVLSRSLYQGSLAVFARFAIALALLFTACVFLGVYRFPWEKELVGVDVVYEIGIIVAAYGGGLWLGKIVIRSICADEKKSIRQKRRSLWLLIPGSIVLAYVLSALVIWVAHLLRK